VTDIFTIFRRISYFTQGLRTAAPSPAHTTERRLTHSPITWTQACLVAALKGPSTCCLDSHRTVAHIQQHATLPGLHLKPSTFTRPFLKVWSSIQTNHGQMTYTHVQ